MSVAALDRSQRDPARRQGAPLERVEFRRRDGRRRTQVLSTSDHAVLLADLLHSDCGGLVEVVGADRTTDGRLDGFDRTQRENFVPAGDRAAFLARVAALSAGARREVFLTPATLTMPKAGNDSVDSALVAWVDIDDPRRIARLRAFPHAPHAVVASGSGGVHAYWRLGDPVSGDQLDETNRKLAGALGADLQSCNRGRIMRVPGTLNWKRAQEGQDGAWCRVVMCDLAKPGYSPTGLTRGLSDPKAIARPPRPVRRPRDFGGSPEPWEDLVPADYYRVIVGREPREDGMVRCPHAAHEDLHPSAKLYDEPGSGWFCFACGAGGGAADMVAALKGWPTGRHLRGDQFKACIAELCQLFGVDVRGVVG